MRDADVRGALRERLHRDHDGDADTLIVEEMGVWSGSVRIDVAVINGELSGYELKSDRDTLERLPAQADVYSRVFDRVTLVVGAKHAIKAFTMVPTWWGRTVARSVRGRVALEVERPSGFNPTLDAHLLAQLLWKDEALAVLDQFGLARGWRSKRAREIYAHLVAELPLRALAEQVRATLKARSDWLRQTRTRKHDVPADTNRHPFLKRSGLLNAGARATLMLGSAALATSFHPARAGWSCR